MLLHEVLRFSEIRPDHDCLFVMCFLDEFVGGNIVVYAFYCLVNTFQILFFYSDLQSMGCWC
jgi:hypothetical protein